jgi:hypothetical protein
MGSQRWFTTRDEYRLGHCYFMRSIPDDNIRDGYQLVHKITMMNTLTNFALKIS